MKIKVIPQTYTVAWGIDRLYSVILDGKLDKQFSRIEDVNEYVKKMRAEHDKK